MIDAIHVALVEGGPNVVGWPVLADVRTGEVSGRAGEAEGFYNPTRRHTNIGGWSPAESEDLRNRGCAAA